MSGRYVRLGPGRYTLAVAEGQGPAGVRRSGDGACVAVDVEGGRVDFVVRAEEDVYYWWRGPRERSGVRLFGVSGVARKDEVVERSEAWPAVTTG